MKKRTALLAFLGCAAIAAAQDLPPRQTFEISTGPVSGPYFPAAELIARIVSHPPGLVRCEKSPLCGPPGVIVSALSSEGAISNILAVNSGRAASGLAPGNIVADAVAGRGAFRKNGRQSHVRVIADLFTEQLLLVVPVNSPVKTIAGLSGRRISLGRTNADFAQSVLTAYGVRRTKLLREPLDTNIRLIGQGKIDAFFVLRQAGDPAVTALVQSGRVRLIPIGGKVRARLVARAKGVLALSIPAGSWRGQGAYETIGSNTYWIVADRASADAVYGLVRALYHPGNRAALAQGAPPRLHGGTAASLTLLPLHPGAARYWREAGILTGR